MIIRQLQLKNVHGADEGTFVRGISSKKHLETEINCGRARRLSLVCRMTITRRSRRERESFTLYIMNSYRWICAQYKHESLSPLPAKVVWPICVAVERTDVRWFHFVSHLFSNDLEVHLMEAMAIYTACSTYVFEMIIIAGDGNYDIRRTASLQGKVDKNSIEKKKYLVWCRWQKLLNWQLKLFCIFIFKKNHSTRDAVVS